MLVVLRLLPFAGFASKGLYWDFRADELSGPVGTWVSGVPYELWTEGIGRPRDNIDSLDSYAGSDTDSWNGSLLANMAGPSLEAFLVELCFICCGDPLSSWLIISLLLLALLLNDLVRKVLSP